MNSTPIIPPSRDDVYDIPEDADGGDEFVGDSTFGPGTEGMRRSSGARVEAKDE